MAEQADALEREDGVDLNLEPEAPEPDVPETGETDPPDPEAETPEPEPGEDEGFEISFGDEAAPASRGSDSDLVQHLRKVNREQAEKLAKYERGEIPAQPQTEELGPKPTLESCDWDEAKFEEALVSYKEREARVNQAQAEAQKRAAADQERVAKKFEAFAAGKMALGAKDYEVAEIAVVSKLSPAQSAIVVRVAENSAQLIYALGRHPQKLATLAAIEDPWEFAGAVAKLEGTLKVTRAARTPPEPDRPLRGDAPLSNRTDKDLERLEKEAERTNDRSKVIAYKRKLKAQARK